MAACSGKALRFTYQRDGNLVLYCNSSAIWASNTAFSERGQSPDWASFQVDGNLVVYSVDPVFGTVAAWASGTDNKGAKLVLQGDANLVIYNSNNQAVWASNTHGRC
ncbi:MAG TPA: hypothetical protein VFN35_30950 [Ktedonobacteraceae bacterium]|nr:hypothetical protein [Ktedonobacteraceae bacterium]